MNILSISQIRAAEKDAVSNGIFSFKDLMQNAAKGAFEYLNERIIDGIENICIVCGNGNNGGDGLVLAKMLKDSGNNVSLVFPNGLPKTEPATEFLSLTKEINVINNIPLKCDILIDALFGIGFNRPLDEYGNSIIDKMNRCDAFKVALDVPSGVNGDGEFAEKAFYADLTLTFIALKPCFVLPKTNDFCGKVKVIDIGITASEYSFKTTERPQKSRKNKNSHKGTFGTVLTVTGSYGMCGASILSSKSALVSGVGIVKSFVCDKNYSAFTSAVPEAVTIPCETFISGAPMIPDRQLISEIGSADSLLLGCGLGTSNEAKDIVKRVLEFTNIPTVIDADGINIVSENIELLKKMKVPKIITPHPKEMARLCKTTVSEIEKNRVEIAKRVAINTNSVVVLKGSNTIIASPDGEIFFNMTGNIGLATGGSGDVLAGMITARLCLGELPLTAAKNAVWLHGYAADRLLKKYTFEGILPSDIIAELKTI